MLLMRYCQLKHPKYVRDKYLKSQLTFIKPFGKILSLSFQRTIKVVLTLYKPCGKKKVIKSKFSAIQ